MNIYNKLIISYLYFLYVIFYFMKLLKKRKGGKGRPSLGKGYGKTKSA